MRPAPAVVRQARAVARRDLVRERRAGEVASVTIPFGAVALLLIPLAVGIDAPTLQRIGPGLYWIVVLLFGVLVAVRRTAVDGGGAREVATRLGIDPAAELVGQATATTVMLLVFELVVGAVAVVLYDLDLSRWTWLLVVLPAAAIGLGLLSTIAAWIATGAGSAGLVPFLVAPLAIPILLAAGQVLDPSLSGTGGILSWVLLLLLVDVVLAVVGVLIARPLQEVA